MTGLSALPVFLIRVGLVVTPSTDSMLTASREMPDDPRDDPEGDDFDKADKVELIAKPEEVRSIGG